jgi:hypothetical protein
MKKLLLLFLLTSFTCFSQKYKVDRLNGMNMKSFNMTISLSEDEIIYDTGDGLPTTPIYIIDVEEKDDKKYYYTQVSSMLKESYYVVYTIKKGKKIITIIEQYVEIAGKVTNLKYEVSLIE